MKRRLSRKKRSETLHKIAELVESFCPKDINTYYDKFFQYLKKIINFEHATIFYLNDDIKSLEIIASTGKSVDLINDISFEYGNGLSAWNAKKKKTLLLNNLKTSNTNRDLLICSFLSIPLVLENRLLGILNFSHSNSFSFSKDDVKHLEVITPLLAAILSKNVFIKRLKDQNDKIEEMNSKILMTQELLVKAEQKIAVSATICSLNHEINNPLMIISGYIQLLQIKVSENHEDYEKFELINEQVTRIASILKKLREIENPLFEEYIKDGRIDKMLKIPEK